ncbi:MAG: hypothetical protein GC147_08640 [Porphyrobacter sp.]|nr:hypothetical protein [Porphyrobacter sp.]
MFQHLNAVLWALSILFVAVLAEERAIPGDSAATLLVVLPLLAALSLRSGAGCSRRRRREPQS